MLEVHSAQIGETQIDLAEIGVLQIFSSEIGATQVEGARMIGDFPCLSPRVPYGGTLAQDCQVFGITRIQVLTWVVVFEVGIENMRSVEGGRGDVDAAQVGPFEISTGQVCSIEA